MSDMVTSMKEAGKMLVEAFGMPLITELKPAFEEITKDIRGARVDVGQFARTLGRDVGQWVRDAAGLVQDGFEYIRTNADEIKAAIVSGFETAKAVVQWILDNRELIAIAFGARMAAPVIGAAGRAGAAVYRAGAAGGAGAGLMGAAGGATALGAFVVAIGSAALAVEQFSLLLDDLQTEEMKDAQARKTALEKMAQDFTRWDAAQEKHFDAMGKQFLEGADALGMSEAQARAFVKELDASRDAGRSMARQVEAAAMQIENIQAGLEMGTWKDPEQAALNMQAATAFLGTAFQNAANAGNQGQMMYIANLLARSRDLQEAFLQSGTVTASGFEALAELVKGQADDFAKRLRGEAEAREKGAAKPAAPQIRMSGGQTFHIKQDFRDQDPDRILIAFRQDMAAAATRRIQARGASPFGT
jgi:hypothetical protein